jgi:hypothetical protein
MDVGSILSGKVRFALIKSTHTLVLDVRVIVVIHEVLAVLNVDLLERELVAFLFLLNI